MEKHTTSAATLRVIGDDLVPEDITWILGCEPTSTAFKGQIIRGKNTGRERIARTGCWYLEVHDRTPDNLDGQIMEIVSRLNPDPEVWPIQRAAIQLRPHNPAYDMPLGDQLL